MREDSVTIYTHGHGSFMKRVIQIKAVWHFFLAAECQLLPT